MILYSYLFDIPFMYTKLGLVQIQQTNIIIVCSIL